MGVSMIHAAVLEATIVTARGKLAELCNEKFSTKLGDSVLIRVP